MMHFIIRQMYSNRNGGNEIEQFLLYALYGELQE